MFMEALGDAGVMHGLPRGYRLAAWAGRWWQAPESCWWSGETSRRDEGCCLLSSGNHIVGVAALERKGLRSAVIDAVDAIQNKNEFLP